MADRQITIDLIINDQGSVEKLRSVDVEIDKVTGKTSQATTATQGLAQAQTMVTGTTGSLIGMLGRYLTAAAIAGAIKGTLDHAEALTKMSAQTGIGIEALQRLSHAAKQNETSIQGVSMAINMMSDKIASGDKSAIEALKSMGLEIGTLRTLAPDELFITIAEAIGKIPDPLERAKVRMDLLGKAGVEVSGLLVPNLREMTNEADRMGLVLETKTVKNMDALGDSVSALMTAGKSLVGNVLGPLSPLFIQVAGAAQIAATAIGYVVGAVTRMAMAYSLLNRVQNLKNMAEAKAEEFDTTAPALPPAPSGLPVGTGPLPPTVPQFGSGGFVDRPTLALIGEHGPEYVVPADRMGMTVIVNAQGAVFENESAIDRLAQKVQRVISDTYGMGVKAPGRA